MSIGRTAQSTATGAAAGSAFGPWGTVIGGGLGLISSLFGDDPQDNVAAANARKLQLMQQAQSELGAYRPQLMAAENGALNRRLGSFKGAQDALATMYGGGAPQMPMGHLPDPSMLGQGPTTMSSTRMLATPGAGRGVNAPTQVTYPEDSIVSSPPMGNGPPLGTIQKKPGLPDPMSFMGRR